MASLNFLERNVLVRGIREGKSFEEAAKALPLQMQKHPDLAKNWKAWAEAEAKKDDLETPKTIRFDPDELVRLRTENSALLADVERTGALAEKLNAEVAALRAENEALKKPAINGKR